MRHATEAVRLNPGDAASHTVRGYALMRTRHLDDAIAEFRASLAIRPSNNDASRYLSDALAARNAAPNSRRPR
jgi:Flp pilus assembly protein TadD